MSSDFADRMTTILNEGALAIMISLGHRVGLFDTLADLPPATSQQVADAAGLHERYVREWLAAMVTGGVVTYEPADLTYTLPAAHAAHLTRAAGPDNLAIQAQYIPMAAAAQDAVADCFRNGGGVPYPHYRDFHELMAEDSASVQDEALVGGILPLVPGLEQQLQAGIDVADVGCGSGHAVNLIARAFPASRVTGYDFSAEGIAAGRAEAAAWGLANARFVEQDVTHLDVVAAYDLITAFDAIHDQAHPARVLSSIARALRPDGVFLMVDIAASSRLEENAGHALGPFLYTLSTLHCMTVSLALGGVGLGTMWGEQTACGMLAEAGFDSVEVARIEDDFLNAYFIARRSGAR